MKYTKKRRVFTYIEGPYPILAPILVPILVGMSMQLDNWPTISLRSESPVDWVTADLF